MAAMAAASSPGTPRWAWARAGPLPILILLILLLSPPPSWRHQYSCAGAVPVEAFAAVPAVPARAPPPRRPARAGGVAVLLASLNDDPSDVSWDLNRSLRLLRTTPPTKTLPFSALLIGSGALLGPFLDSYHSLFGVLSYEQALTAQLWGSGMNNDLPALVTAWWVPELFGLAGFLIGWLYVLLDAASATSTGAKADGEHPRNGEPISDRGSDPTDPSWPKIWAGISFFTLQYWLSGVLYANGCDRSTLLQLMSVLAAAGFAALDGTMAGFLTSTATAVGGPLIEVGLITILVGHGGYHYNDLGETGYFPLWIVPVYFLGGPAVGNLARGYWRWLLPPELSSAAEDAHGGEMEGPGCRACGDSRAVGCPNCDAAGYYVTYGQKVRCVGCGGLCMYIAWFVSLGMKREWTYCTFINEGILIVCADVCTCMSARPWIDSDILASIFYSSDPNLHSQCQR